MNCPYLAGGFTYFSLMEYIDELRGATHANVRPFFLAYLDAGFLFLGLDAVELRIGSAK